MARPDGPEGDGSPRRRQRNGASPPASPHDWTPKDEPPPDSPPRRRRSRRQVQDVGSAAAEAAAELLSQKRSSRRRRHSPHGASSSPQPPPPSRASASMRVPNSAVPLLSPTAAAPPFHGSPRRQSWAVQDDNGSPSDGRRSRSRRDISPPSARQYRSTPLSRRSSRSSPSESDDDTDVTASTQDDRDRRRQRREVAKEQEHAKVPYRRPRVTEDIIYEEDSDQSPRRQRSPDDRKPSTRRPSERPERHRARRKEEWYRRPDSIEEPKSRSGSRRSSRSYYETELLHADRPQSLRRANTTTGGSHVGSSHSVASSRRSSSFLGNFFGASIQSHLSERPVRLVECLVCMEEVPSFKSAKLKCGHRMCNSCLKRNFKLSITDPQLMPPKCCTSDHIPLRHVEKLFDTSFKKTWNKKFAEFSTRNRIYCPSRRCGEWIKPDHIHREDGRKVARCQRCKTKVCGHCNGRWHHSRDCPKDEETDQFLEQAKQEGWQRCHNCKAMVELKEGCNHMTCRCGGEFCMICGAKWKTCECPWFNYDAVENDRLEHMQIPIPIRLNRPDFGPPSPRDLRAGGARPTAAARPRPQTYEEEMLLRRLQEQRDEDLARRMQALGDFREEDEDYQGGIGDIVGIGNQTGHFMNEDYRRGTQNRVSPPGPAPPAPPSFDRAGDLGMDYVSSGTARPRVARASSMERRLAGRLNTDVTTHGSTRHGHRASSGIPAGPGLHTAPPPPVIPVMPPPPPHLVRPMTLPSMPARPPVGPPAPAPPQPPPISRRHTMGDDVYISSMRSIGRSSSGRERRRSSSQNYHYDDRDAQTEQPAAEELQHRRNRRRQHRKDPPKMSVLAGLTGPGSKGMNRVFEWRTHVEPGVPEGEASPTPA